MKAPKCRCGHAQTYHRPLDAQGFTWCRGDCGCSIFEALHEPDPPHVPTVHQASGWHAWLEAIFHG